MAVAKKKSTSKKVVLKEGCLMHGCNREVQCPQSGLCKRCYSWLYYNRDKTIHELEERRETIQFWDQRLEGHLASQPKKKRRLKSV